MSQVELIESHKSFGGYQNKYKHYSETLDCEMTFQLYLPAEKDEQDLDLIWFLAGLSSSDENFTTKGGFQPYAAAYRLAFVMPDVSPRGDDVAEGDHWDIGQGAGFYLNATKDPWQQHYKMYDYLTQELPSIVYDLLDGFSGNEAIMGHSMGGYGALQIGMKNPDRFKSISAFAPITNPTQVPWGIKAFETYLGEDPEAWKEWDTVALAKKGDLPPLYISQGTDDPFYDEHLQEESFVSACDQANADLTYHKEEGYDHSYYFIASFVEDHIAFHLKHLED